MLRSASKNVNVRLLRRLSTNTSSASGTRNLKAARAVIGGSVLLASATLAASQLSEDFTIYNDANLVFENKKTAKEIEIPAVEDQDGKLRIVVWGSNKNHVLLPGDAAESIRTPATASFLENVALRDLALHDTHAACVDVKGDIYQWGDGFYGASGSSVKKGPKLTLSGKNITQVKLTESRVFALSSSGKIYVLSSQAENQKLASGSKSSGWFGGEVASVDYIEISPSESLSWSEKFVSIAAGRDHLLALTSSGRTFAHPINKNANTHGQLGFRKFDIADTSSTTSSSSRLNVELTPRAAIDPYANQSRFQRRARTDTWFESLLPESSKQDASAAASDKKGLLAVSENLAGVNDEHIRFCDKLFEVPSLKGVKIEQIAAGARSSYAKTDSGRVLGWGANEYGQIGLGSGITVDTVSIPTEVVLWRSNSTSKCIDLNAGGNLAFFTVERTDGTGIPTIDLLSCGNGQYGGLGNAMYSNAQSVPVRTRNVSGLLEYSEKTNNLQPIPPTSLSISPDGHVLLTLDTLLRSGPSASSSNKNSTSGQDLFVWGTNYDYQLGTGKRTSSAVPVNLTRADGHRFMLMRTKAGEVRDGSGKLWKKGVEVEQVAVAGVGGSAVYWRVCQ